MSEEASRLEGIFEAARRLNSGEERRAYLDQACAGDAVLRAEVERLLAADHSAGTFLEERPTYLSEAAPTTVAVAMEGPGSMIGRYRLLEQIGEGGMGVVYMAEQREPVIRRVALKIIKLGMDTKQVVARFEAERQALALMDHPNIAKVLDAGSTEAGRPYFVMELVRGVPITRYCDEQRLDTEARLALFMEVCSAVQHAHQKGIIHRDLKPSNILTAVHGDRAVPMVIDFGIAKATQQRLTDKTYFTQFQQFIGTPTYMSPEQAGLSGQDIDTRSDIYSLGVLLYELLTGRPPFDPKTLYEAGLEEIRRIIREEEPPRPSTRISGLTAEEKTTVARSHRADPRRLAVLLRGDLDWVVMKALEKDRDRRYESANTLAADIQRFLRSEPVTAVAPNTAYRVRKFVRRNRAAVATAGVIATLLVVGITATTWLAVVATRAKNLAAREAVRSAEVARFLKEMLEGVGPARARGRDTAMLREILDAAAERVGTGLKSQPEVEMELRATIGSTYMAAGSLPQAEAMQRAALELARRLYGPAHTNVVLVLDELGWTLRESGQLTEAASLFSEAIALARSLVGEEQVLVAGPMHRLGGIYGELGRYDEAERLLVRSTDLLSRRLGSDHLRTLQARQNLAALYYQRARLAEMEPVAVGALADARRALGEDHPLTQTVKALTAILRQDQGRFAEAESLHAEILATKRRILGADHPNTLTTMDNLALVWGLQGRFAEAEALSRSAMEVYARIGTEATRKAISLRSNHAEYLRNLGRHAEAEREFLRALELGEPSMPESDPTRLETRNSLAILRELQGRPAEAEAILRDVVTIRRNRLAADDPALADGVAHLAGVLISAGKAGEAEPLAREGLEVFGRTRPDDWHRFAAMSQAGACRLALGDVVAAEPLLREGQAGLEVRLDRVPVIDRLRYRESMERLVELYRVRNMSEEAARWRDRLTAFDASPTGQLLLAARGGNPR